MGRAELLLAMLALAASARPVRPSTYRGASMSGVTCTLHTDGDHCQSICQKLSSLLRGKCIIDLCHCFHASTSAMLPTLPALPTSTTQSSSSPPPASTSTPTPTPSAPSSSRSTASTPAHTIAMLECSTPLDGAYCNEQCQTHGASLGQCVNNVCFCVSVNITSSPIPY